jgi:hypothetical protein
MSREVLSLTCHIPIRIRIVTWTGARSPGQ